MEITVIYDILKNLPTSEKGVVEITIGNFKNGFGDYSLNRELFSAMTRKLLTFAGNYTRNNQTIYVHRNKCLMVQRHLKSKSVVSFRPIKSQIIKNLAITVKEYENVVLEDFPILNKYHLIVNQHIKTFWYGKNVNIKLITESRTWDKNDPNQLNFILITLIGISENDEKRDNIYKNASKAISFILEETF